MCTTCGCSTADHDHRPRSSHDHHHDGDHGHKHKHSHDHDGHTHSHDDSGKHSHEGGHSHRHDAETGKRTTVSIEEDILGKNNRLAGFNRALFREKGIFVLNLVSSPGSGKTTLLERTLRDLSAGAPLRRHRRRPADRQRCPAHRRHRSSGASDQHRRRVPSGCPHDHARHREF